MTNEDLKHIEYKRLLSILGELNNLEVLILKSHTMLHGDSPEHRKFWEKHEESLTPPIAYLGSSQEEMDKDTIYQTHNTHLARLGLLEARFKTPKRGEIPEFDEKTGMLKVQGYNITDLGSLLLRNIDQGGEF